MRNILSKIISALFCAACFSCGAALLACDFPENIVWNIFGLVIMLAGACALVSAIACTGREKRSTAQ